MSKSLMAAVAQHGFGGPEVLRLEQVPRPEPLPTEVLVRVHAAGVNPVDWKTRAGGGMAGVLGEPPFVLGWDVSGVVEHVGYGVTTLAPGDQVYGMPWFPRAAGGYAEYVTAPSRQFARKPETVSHEVAAAVPLAALTAWQVLTDTAHVQPEQRVLIHAAAGGVGHIAVQLAKHLGAHVIGTARAGSHDWPAGLQCSPFLVEPDGPALGTLAELIDAGDLAVTVQDVLPLAQAAQAHRLGETDRTRGKLVLHVNS